MSEQTISVRRDRISVLASGIVKELASARVREIEKDEIAIPEPPFVITPRMRELAKQYAASRRQMKQAEHEAGKLGARIECSYRDDAKPEITRAYRNHDAEKERKRAARAERSRTVKKLRTDALIELVTLDPNQVKAAVQKFRAAIEKV